MSNQRCQMFNRDNPVGTKVIYTDDKGKQIPTRVEIEAQTLGKITPVVWLEDIRGCVHLDRVRKQS